VQYLVVPLCRLAGRDLQSDFTPFRITLSASNRTFSCAAAKRDFGYEPQVGGWAGGPAGRPLGGWLSCDSVRYVGSVLRCPCVLVPAENPCGPADTCSPNSCLPAAHAPLSAAAQVSVDDALKRTLKHFSHLHASKQKQG
jgi:hypothetical protein